MSRGYFICFKDRRKIFGAKMVKVIIFHEVGRPASASHLGAGRRTAVKVSTQTADTENFVKLLCR